VSIFSDIESRRNDRSEIRDPAISVCYTIVVPIKQKPLNIKGLSALTVTPRGFEPPTNRTGICHSIQLNYGARKPVNIPRLDQISEAPGVWKCQARQVWHNG
jgi:hypothetical protein